MAIRKVGDRVKEWFGNFEGVITAVHEVPGEPELSVDSIEWDDGQFPDEVWSEEDLAPVGVDHP